MRIAVTYDNGQVFGHFGHTKQFKLYTVEQGAVVSSQVVDTNGSGHGALGMFLKALNVDALICGGIGPGAQTALENAGITMYAGVSGSADDAVGRFLAENLVYSTQANCDHHAEGGDCGHHCGSESCGH